MKGTTKLNLSPPKISEFICKIRVHPLESAVEVLANC